MTEEEYKYLHGVYFRLKYEIELSIIYHRKLEKIYDFLDKITKAISIIGSSSALYNMANNHYVSISVFIITIFSTLSLVFDYSNKARQHSEIAKQFVILASDLAKKGERDYQEDDIKEWASRKIIIESNETNNFISIINICQHQLDRSKGLESKKSLTLWEKTIQIFV